MWKKNKKNTEQLEECCLLVWSLFTLSVLATLGHLSQRERQGIYVRSLFTLSVLAMLGHLSKGRGKEYMLDLYQFGELEFNAQLWS